MNTSLKLQPLSHGQRAAPRRGEPIAATPATRRRRALRPTLSPPPAGLLQRACTALGLATAATLLLALGVPLAVLPLLFAGLLTGVLLIAGLRLD